MDKEERKDGKEKKKRKKTKVPIRRSKKATCVVFPELDERFLLHFSASQIGLNTFLFVNVLARESWPYNHGSSLTHSPLNNT